MNLKFFVLILIWISATQARANFGIKDYSKIDSIALTIKKTNNTEKLSKNLTEKFTAEDEKFRSIFTWIAHNISYDCEAKKTASKRTIDPKKILKQRKAVCAGYSSLFKELCLLSNLECETIEGWTRNYPSKIGKQLSRKTTHAWNAIKIKNTWFLCDVTWAAGSTSNNCTEFNFDFKDYYFCTKPELFCINHYPENKKWLLDGKMSKTKFINSPHHYGNAIDFGIAYLKPSKGILKYEKGKQINFQFDIGSNSTFEKLTVFVSSEKYSHPVEFTRSNNTISFNYELIKYGNKLSIYLDGKCILVYKMIK